MEDSEVGNNLLVLPGRQKRRDTSNIYSGKLKKMSLANLITHEHFVINFNSLIDFTTGENCNEKSAIVSALVAGFRQRASVTSRGESVKDFIKRGRHQAVIEITFYNTEDNNGYKYSDYGNEITIVRKISHTGSSTYKVKGQICQEQTVNFRELGLMLLQFNLLVHNPLCVPSQDTLKMYIAELLRNSMCKFMKDNHLETVENVQQLKHVAEIKVYLELVTINKAMIEAMQKEDKAGRVKVEEELRDFLKGKVDWSEIKDWKSNFQDKSTELEEAEKDFLQWQPSDDNYNLSSVSSSEFQKYDETWNASKVKSETLDTTIKTSEIYKSNIMDRIEQHILKLDELKIKLGKINAKKAEVQGQLVQFKEVEGLSLYASWMPELIKKIDLVFKSGKFSERPKGPLGKYIEVVDKKWAPAIEKVLSEFLKFFCVPRYADCLMLQEIFNSVIPRGEQPDIITGEFPNQVYDTTETEVKSDQYSNLLRNLKISDPAVANCLIDTFSVETILLIDDLEDALTLLQHERTVPQFCKFACTLDGDCVYPSPDYRYYGGGDISDAQILQNDYSEQLRNSIFNLQNESEELEGEKSIIRIEINELINDLRSCNSELNELEEEKLQVIYEKYKLEDNCDFEPRSVQVSEKDEDECMS